MSPIPSALWTQVTLAALGVLIAVLLLLDAALRNRKRLRRLSVPTVRLSSRLGQRIRRSDGHPPVIVVLIAAHNEERSIAATIRSQLAQRRRADRIVVAADNCTDRTVSIARSMDVTVMETRHNRTRKPGALNQAWREYCDDADLVVCIDADTELDPEALRDWEAEFLGDPFLGGCSAKFTMLVHDGMTWFQRLLVRLQRAEFAKWTDLALKRQRRTNVLAGTACCVRNDALRQIVAWRGTVQRMAAPGPWLESSVVEDFELTYRMREMGWRTRVSGTVRAYTDAMTDLRSLWAQRMKWQVGTVSDLLDFGFNDLTRFDWWQQAQGLAAIVVRVLWLALLAVGLAIGHLEFRPLWLLPPVLFLANDIRQSLRIPRRQAADVVLAALLLPQELFAVMRACWFLASWIEVLSGRARTSMYTAAGMNPPRGRDHWGMQFRAEHGR